MPFWDNYVLGQEAGTQEANNITLGPIQRQSALEALQASKQANALTQLKLNTGELTYQDMLGARALGAGGGSTQPAPATQSPSSAAGLGATPTAAPAAITAPAAAPAPTSGPPTPAAAEDSTLNSDMADAGLAPKVDPAVAAAAVASGAVTPPGSTTAPAAQQPVPHPDAHTEATSSGNAPVQPGTSEYMNRLTALRDYWTGKDDAKAKELNTEIQAEAQRQGNMAAVGTTNLPDYYTTMAKISMTAAHAEMVEKAVTTVFDAYDKGGVSAVQALAPQIRQMAPEFANFDAGKLAIDPSNRFASVDAGNGLSVVFDREHPKDWKVEPMTDRAGFIKGYMQDHPNASASVAEQAYQNFQIQKIAAGKSLNVLNAVPREIAQGVNSQGIMVYKDSHGGAPYSYDANGNKVTEAGKPIYTKNEAINLGGNQPDPVTGLTPVQAKANAKALQDPTNIRTVQLINGVLPVAAKFNQAISNLPDDTPIAAVNTVLRNAGILMNNKQINDAQTFVTEFPREAQRAMVGSGQTAQASLDQQGALFSKAKTVGNLKSSLDIVTGILKDRKAGVLAPVFPPSNYTGPTFAPAGTKVSKAGGGFYTSDGKGGWQ